MKVGDIVKHDYSGYTGKVLETRSSSDGYDYLVQFNDSRGTRDWFKKEVLLPVVHNGMTEKDLAHQSQINERFYS